MATISERAAKLVIRWRWAYVALASALTVFFAVGASRVEVKTIFSDLLPKRNPVIDVFKRYQVFSNPLNVQILLKVKKGTIFTPDVLGKVMRLSRDIDLVPGVDHDTILSIASTKIRVTKATPGGIESSPVMPDVAPTTEEGAQDVRDKARAARGVIGILVSPDEKATLIQAGFHEEGINYDEVFRQIHQVLAKEKDPNIDFYPAGRVMLIGWVYHYGRQALWIFVLSFGLITIAHIDYMRSFAGALTPLIAAIVSTIWGVGAGGWMGLNLEPLTLVVPVLLMARALSHSLQMTRRYYEILYERGNQAEASALALASMFAPAVLGILCDVAGLYMICLAPIPIIQKLGLLCGTWSLLLIPAVVVLTPPLLTILPPPSDVSVFITHEVPSWSTRAIEPVQRFLSKLVTPRWRLTTAGTLIVIAAGVLYLASNRAVGNVTVGSPLLWPKNEFNVAEGQINRNLAGTVTLNVIWEGKVAHAMQDPAVYGSMLEFQQRMEKEQGAAASLSIADYLPVTNRLLHGGSPKWIPVDLTRESVSGALFLTLTGHNLKDVSHLVEPNIKTGDVILWYKDLRSATVERAMEAVKQALAPITKEPSKVFRVRLAAGSVALQSAMDQVVTDYNLRILVYLLAAIFAMSVITYRSFVAAAMLLVPLTLAQFATDAVMYLRGVGLDVNTLPVVAVGVGVGIDYGIYLMSRMCDEYQAAGDGNVEAAVIRSILTTGEATFFVAFAMVAGVLPWYFLSDLRFLADMGLMLALVMAFNAILAMVVLPLLAVFIRPKFLGRVQLMRH